MEQQLIEYFPLNTLMLINGEFPMPVMVTKKEFSEHHDKDTPAIPLKKKIRKFYHKRHFLFKKFDEGIKLDEESWYSVVPEDIGKYISNRLHKRISEQELNISKVIDGFCGSGGLAIQLSQNFHNLICIDLDSVKLENLKVNAKIYKQHIQTELKDFLQFEHEYDENVLMSLCPPWGGVNYHKKQIFDLDIDMKPSLTEIIKHAFTITCNIVVQLPRNIKMQQLISIIQHQSKDLNFKRYSLEIEMIYINKQLSQLFAYFGNIVKPNFDTEIDCILKSQSEKSKLTRKSIKELGMLKVLQSLKQNDEVEL